MESLEVRSSERTSHVVLPCALTHGVPGLDAVVPPLAGTSSTARLRFLAFETGTRQVGRGVKESCTSFIVSRQIVPTKLPT